MTCPDTYWAVQGPDDDHPELFFRNEQWARAALAASLEDRPELIPLVKVFPVRVSFEPQGGGR